VKQESNHRTANGELSSPSRTDHVLKPPLTRREFTLGAGISALLFVTFGCGNGDHSVPAGNNSGSNNTGGNSTGGGNGGSGNGGGSTPLTVYSGSALSPGFDMGVNTSGGLTNWVTDEHGDMNCAYPSGQQWGAVFLTVGTPTSDTSSRKTIDVSAYSYLALDLKGASGGERVSIGVKTEADPDNGLEPKYVASNLTTSWQTIKIPLTSLVSGPNYPMSRFSHLYVVCELVFDPDLPETVFFRNVEFLK